MLGYTLKSGVWGTPSSMIEAALGVAEGLYGEYGYPLVITSLQDGVHATNSKHYTGQAADLRTSNLDPSIVAGLAQELQARLGAGYWVLLESDHIHVQETSTGGLPIDPNEPGEEYVPEPETDSNIGLWLVGGLIVAAIVLS